MTASNISGPLNIGPKSPVGEPSAVGSVVLAQTATLVRTGTTPGTGVVAFNMPMNSQLVGMDAVVYTAFNAGTTATLSLTDGSDEIVAGFDLTSAGLLSLQGGDATVASSTLFMNPSAGENTLLYLEYDESGTAGTDGEVHVTLFYLQGNAGQD